MGEQKVVRQMIKGFLKETKLLKAEGKLSPLNRDPSQKRLHWQSFFKHCTFRYENNGGSPNAVITVPLRVQDANRREQQSKVAAFERIITNFGYHASDYANRLAGRSTHKILPPRSAM